MVKNHPCYAGARSSIPGQGTKIPHAAEQLSWSTTTTMLVQNLYSRSEESVCRNQRSWMQPNKEIIFLKKEERSNSAPNGPKSLLHLPMSSYTWHFVDPYGNAYGMKKCFLKFFSNYFLIEG